MNDPFAPAKQQFDPIARMRAAVGDNNTRVTSGKLLAITGTVIEAELPGARMGELCELRSIDTGTMRQAEVIGLDGSKAFLAPYGLMAGLSIKTEVIATGRSPSVLVGDFLLGCVTDAFGRPVPDGRARLPQPGPDAIWRSVQNVPPDPMTRRGIDRPFEIGLRVIDSLTTVGEGQRVGIFGSAGAGKSTLQSEIIQNCEAEIFVVCLVGERGREVGDFVRHVLTPERRDQTVVVVSTSDRPPVERMQAAYVATTIAEHYRDKGKKVMLMVDSVTRYARALRDLGLSAGEPPTRRGFPPSVFSLLPILFERAGMGPLGSITAFYTVLVEGESTADPVAEETRSLLDGHIILSDKLAHSGHYPAIDALGSRSRIMNEIVDNDHKKAAIRIRELMSRYKDLELLIQVGEYKPGNDPLSDEAVRKIDEINKFLKQGIGETSTFEQTVQRMKALAWG